MNAYRLAAILFFLFGFADAAFVATVNLSSPSQPMDLDGAMLFFVASCAAGTLARGEGRKP